MVPPDVDVVLFDLGGVLADFGGVSSMRRLSGLRDDEEVWRRWLSCRWVRLFERGGCSPEDFAAGVVDDWALPVSPELFLREFAGWLVGALPGADELVAEVRRSVPVGILSNTNAVHFDAGLGSWPLLGRVDHRFLSFELGLVKPDAELFEHVCGRLATAPARVLFLDDNVVNVDAARRVGLRAVQARGVDAARRALSDAGVIGAPRP